mmetsp:Transcript_615/g.1907  ORF Transcript_615/g.1907 Transcript_615/m.1907 type:complete len:85 (-) Transcript_615:2882-3136(-)
MSAQSPSQRSASALVATVDGLVFGTIASATLHAHHRVARQAAPPPLRLLLPLSVSLSVICSVVGTPTLLAALATLAAVRRKRMP